MGIWIETYHIFQRGVYRAQNHLNMSMQPAWTETLKNGETIPITPDQRGCVRISNNYL